MNLLVVGLSYRTAPVDLLERVTVPPAEAGEVLRELVGQAYVGEALMLSTCNRVEVYATVSAFHGGLGDIGAVLAARALCPVSDLAPHLYVHFGADAVRHTFRVAAGLESMVAGEAQILGQLREAYATAAEHDTAGRMLHELMQQALRVGKRVHTETGIDRAGQSVVSASLEIAARTLGPRLPAARQVIDPAVTLPTDGGDGVFPGHPGPQLAHLAGRPALVLGAGSMGALALATLHRAGAAPLYIANRTADRASRLAELHEAAATPFDDLHGVLTAVDVVVCATASPGHVLTAPAVSAALADRDPRRAPLVVLDLAVPRDVQPEVAALPGVVLVDIQALGRTQVPPLLSAAAADFSAAEEIVAAELEAFLAWLRGTDVTPTVAALRVRADEVVSAELRRFNQRRTELTDAQRAEVAQTVHRVVQRLLHQPTVRVRKLAAEPGGEAYAALLRELFDLDVPGPLDATDLVRGGPLDAAGIVRGGPLDVEEERR